MNNKSKSIFYTITYFRSFLITIPINILAIGFCISNLNKSLTDYKRVEGVISKSFIRWDNAPYYISLEQYPNEYFVVYYKGFFNILRKKAEVGVNVEIWYDNSEAENEVKQLKINEDLLIPYNKHEILWLILLVISIIIIIANIAYLFYYLPNRRKINISNE